MYNDRRRTQNIAFTDCMRREEVSVGVSEDGPCELRTIPSHICINHGARFSFQHLWNLKSYPAP